MNYVIVDHAQGGAGVLRLTSWIGLAAVMPWTWARRWRNRRELLGLLAQPEYILKDVGLARDVITREGLKPFWTE